jgi:hypothetical protein
MEASWSVFLLPSPHSALEENRMKRSARASFLFAAIASIAIAQSHHDPASLMAAQREAMKVFSAMDGAWRGPAWTILPGGAKVTMTQTERIGSFLDGTVKVVEGRGYDQDGKVGFNALGIISYDPASKTYSMRTHAMGRSGEYKLTPSAGGGYSWEIPAGPGMTIRYTATIADGKWKEVGERIVEGKDPVVFTELNLERIGDSDWPEAGAVPHK